MITIYFKAEQEDELTETATPREGCWIHVDEATTSDITQLSKIIGLEYTDLSDCLDRYEIPRIERAQEAVRRRVGYENQKWGPETLAGVLDETHADLESLGVFASVDREENQPPPGVGPLPGVPAPVYREPPKERPNAKDPAWEEWSIASMQQAAMQIEKEGA